jgi:hypothetical protein
MFWTATAVSGAGRVRHGGRRQFAGHATVRKGIRLTAQVPMIVAAHERIRNV